MAIGATALFVGVGGKPGGVIAIADPIKSTTRAVPLRSLQKEMTAMVGDAPMYPSKNIIENAGNSKDHTTFVAAVKAAG